MNTSHNDTEVTNENKEIVPILNTFP